MRRSICAWLFPLLLLAAPLLAQPDADCKVKVRDAATPDTDQAAFSGTQILDLTLVVTLKKVPPGDHLIRLRVLAPSGNLYQELVVPYGSGPGNARSRSVAGYPRPVAVQTPRRDSASGKPRLAVTLPVAGTAIVTSSLYGAWRVEAYLDGASVPCDTTGFQLGS